MNRAVKNVFLLFMAFFLVLSLCSCATIFKMMDALEYRIDAGPYTPFTPLSFEFEGIDQPEHAWTYHWPEKYESTLESATAPLTDGAGNVYFVGTNRYLYAMDSFGERKWEKENFFDPLLVCEEGLIVRARDGVKLLDFGGKVIWEKERSIEHFFLDPNGFLIGSYFDRLFCLDAKGKLRWHYLVEDDHYDHFLFQSCFFDKDANGYYLFSGARAITTEQNEYDRYEYHSLLISLSPDGEFRWKKVLSTERQFLEDFLPTKESQVKDTFLLAFRMSGTPGTIKAFKTDGELLWEMEESYYSLLGYAIDQDNNFYFSFREWSADFRTWSMMYAYLMSWSKDGNLRWSTSRPYSIETPPLLDTRGHLYVGTEEGRTNLMAFYPNGEEKWSTKVDALYRYKHSLTFGPDRSLYFTSRLQSLLFCVREEN